MDFALIALGIVVVILASLEIKRLWTSRATTTKADIGSGNDYGTSQVHAASPAKPNDAKVVSKRKSRPQPSSSHSQSSDTDHQSRHSRASTSTQHKRGSSGHSKQQHAHAHSHTHSSSTSSVQYGQGSRPSDAHRSHSSDLNGRTSPPRSAHGTKTHIHSPSLGNKFDDSDKELESFRLLLESNVKELLEEVRLHEDEEFLAESDHGNQAGQDPPGRYYREMARQEAIRKRNAYEASKRAYKMGQGGEARRLSEEGRVCEERLRQYNAQAAAEIFAAWNPRYNSGQSSSGRPFSRCDLHGLHVEEALEYARMHLINCRRAGVDKTMIIVGKGSHSQQGPRIGPAILQMMSQTNDVIAGMHERNDGCIVVEFAGHHQVQYHHQPTPPHYMRQGQGVGNHSPAICT